MGEGFSVREAAPTHSTTRLCLFGRGRLGLAVTEGRIRYHADEVTVTVALNTAGHEAVQAALYQARQLQIATQRPPIVIGVMAAKKPGNTLSFSIPSPIAASSNSKSAYSKKNGSAKAAYLPNSSCTKAQPHPPYLPIPPSPPLPIPLPPHLPISVTLNPLTAKHDYLICYDIRDPKRWRKAYKVLKGYGETLQYSIFRVRLTVRDLPWARLRQREQLRLQLEQILTADDSLLIIGLCNRCIERVIACNRPEVWTTQRDLHATL